MTEPVQASFYGIKSAHTKDLVPMVEGGNEQARDELKGRLPHQLAGLLDMCLVVYRDRSHVLDVLTDDLSRLKAAA